MNEIAVEPVAPIMAKTNANDLIVIANVYPVINKIVVIAKNTLREKGTIVVFIDKSSSTEPDS